MSGCVCGWHSVPFSHYAHLILGNLPTDHHTILCPAIYLLLRSQPLAAAHHLFDLETAIYCSRIERPQRAECVDVGWPPSQRAGSRLSLRPRRTAEMRSLVSHAPALRTYDHFDL